MHTISCERTARILEHPITDMDNSDYGIEVRLYDEWGEKKHNPTNFSNLATAIDYCKTWLGESLDVEGHFPELGKEVDIE